MIVKRNLKIFILFIIIVLLLFKKVYLYLSQLKKNKI